MEHILLISMLIYIIAIRTQRVAHITVMSKPNSSMPIEAEDEIYLCKCVFIIVRYFSHFIYDLLFSFFLLSSVVCRLWFVPNFGPVDESEPCRRYVPKNNKYFCNKFFNLVRLIAKWCFLRHFAPLESRHRCTASCSIFLYYVYVWLWCVSKWMAILLYKFQLCFDFIYIFSRFFMRFFLHIFFFSIGLFVSSFRIFWGDIENNKKPKTTSSHNITQQCYC